MMSDTVHKLQVTSCLALSIRQTYHLQPHSKNHAGASRCIAMMSMRFSQSLHIAPAQRQIRITQ